VNAGDQPLEAAGMVKVVPFMGIKRREPDHRLLLRPKANQDVPHPGMGDRT